MRDRFTRIPPKPSARIFASLLVMGAIIASCHGQGPPHDLTTLATKELNQRGGMAFPARALFPNYRSGFVCLVGEYSTPMEVWSYYLKESGSLLSPSLDRPASYTQVPEGYTAIVLVGGDSFLDIVYLSKVAFPVIDYRLGCVRSKDAVISRSRDGFVLSETGA